MELWVRTQNRERLIKCENIYIDNIGYTSQKYYISADSIKVTYKLGEYKTKERALEVMKEIEAGILYAGLPQREIEANLRNKDIKMQGNYEFNTITNVALYTMPEE